MQPEPSATNLQQENVVYLRNWAAATDREVQDILTILAPLQRRLEKTRERLDLITRLADLVETEMTGSSEEPIHVDVTDQGTAGKPPEEAPKERGPQGPGVVFGGQVKGTTD